MPMYATANVRITNSNMDVGLSELKYSHTLLLQQQVPLLVFLGNVNPLMQVVGHTVRVDVILESDLETAFFGCVEHLLQEALPHGICIVLVEHVRRHDVVQEIVLTLFSAVANDLADKLLNALHGELSLEVQVLVHLDTELAVVFVESSGGLPHEVGFLFLLLVLQLVSSFFYKAPCLLLDLAERALLLATTCAPSSHTLGYVLETPLRIVELLKLALRVNK